ncbi:hypothetical protein KIS1582_2970 [Cytobacillus firmus]|uniref:Uncharacterized protein n=1 Tax=Cytobacillus firmus TaxID=1399 RepID=A0A800MVJ6_CYTFI|nr:hypothetical protein KIS1582_2970 [Cytobacillus firmus]
MIKIIMCRDGVAAVRARTRRQQSFNVEEIKFRLTTVFLHLSFYAMIIFILILFLELFG